MVGVKGKCGGTFPHFSRLGVKVQYIPGRAQLEFAGSFRQTGVTPIRRNEWIWAFAANGRW